MSPATRFQELFEMAPAGPDAWSAPSLEYPWGHVYGGQVAAQGLWAAGQTADTGHHPHSLHAYFIRLGRFDQPITFEVDRIRDGRSFVTRRVLARQGEDVILNLSASFHRPEDEPSSSTISMPDDSPLADAPRSEAFISCVERREDPADRARAWIRLDLDYESTPLMEAVVHTYTSDDLPTEAVQFAHPLGRSDYSPEAPGRYMGASLDHAVWFHDLAPANEWTMHDFRSSGVRGGRGHATGELWNHHGRHVATVAQEVLLRVAR